MQQLLTKGFGHTKFKETPIGEIPEEWEVLKQGDVATFFNGRAYKQKEFVKEGTPVVRIQNLTGGGNYVYSNLELNKNKYISTGDLVYAWSATFGPYIWQGPEAIYHYHIWKIECGNKIDKMFFYYRLHFLSNESNNQKSGAVFAHLTKSFMESYEIALPPINEQEKIVTILGSIDKKITSEEQKCVKLKFLKQGLMQDLLTGKVRVPIDNEEVVET
nr:restriction endonuclease subunit S [Virgibacillus litoralis]